MNKIKNFGIILSTFMILLSGSALLAANAYADLTIKANHDHIKIDSFYHGSTVSVQGEADAGSDIVITITSPNGHQFLKKKGKAGGFLWMNVGDLNLEQTPNLYFLHSTGKLDDILDQEEQDKYVLGYPSVKNHADIKPVVDEADKTKWFDEFIKFKESIKLYTTSSGNITITKEDGKQKYYILCDWPYQATPGNYLVTVYAVKDNKVIEKTDQTILVEKVGAVKMLSDMANNQGALYGSIAIFVALLSGFGVGIIFGKDGGAH